MRPIHTFLVAATVMVAIGSGQGRIVAAEQSRSTPVSYYRDVRPIFQENCQGCHQPAKREGGLVLTSLDGMKKGGDSGDPGFVPGDPEQSTLVSEITPDAGQKPAMPKGRDPLAPAQVALIRRWILEGAKDDTPPAAGAKLDASHPPKYSSPPVISALAFSPDGALLAVSGYHEVLLHKADGSAIVGRLVGLSERIESVAFSPDGKLLAVAGGSPVRMGEIQIWDVESRKLKLSCPVTFDTVYGTRWSDDGKLVAFGCADNTLRAIDASSGKQVLFQGAHDDWVLDTAFSTKGTHLVSVGRDGSMKLTEVATQRFVDNITSITPGALKGGLISVDRHPTKDELLVGGADGEPKTYQMFRTKARVIGDDFNLIRKFDGLPGRVYAVSYLAGGKNIAAASSFNGRGELRVYQAADGKLVSRFEVPEGGLFALACHRDGHRIAVAGFDGIVRLVDADSGKPIKQFVAVPVEPGKVVKSIDVPLRVSGQELPYSASFVRDVMPAMSKMGCNAGTCHGSAKGKNGFKLSLRGYDPLADHRALTDDLAGRRFNRSAPDQSLMLLKASGSVPHTGGVLTRPGEPYYEVLRSWIAAGVKLDLESPRVTAIEVFPKTVAIPMPEMKQQMAVQATYSDGSKRDVTAAAFLDSSQTEVLKVDSHGLCTAVRRGEAAVLARFEGAYAVATVTVMGDRSGFTWTPVPENNYVDALVYEKLKQFKIQPSGLSSDEEFLRRVSLDLTGLPPKPEEVRAFVADRRDTRIKRDEQIDRLIGNPAFVERWTSKWADLLQVNPKLTSPEVAAAMRSWIRQAVSDNMPYDKFVTAILTSSGSTKDNPPAAYYEIHRSPEDLVETSTQLFLGVRFNCNKCHDHPFERWTQNQYYQLAGFFAQVERKPAPGSPLAPQGGDNRPEDSRSQVELISDTGAGEVKHPTTNRPVSPVFPYPVEAPAPAGASRRVQFARWVASPKNRYFATSLVNRIWSYLLGVGLIEPVDDIRAGNPPSNPQLLARLTDDFVARGFDVREMIRLICKSRVYQHSMAANRWNVDDETNYSHALARRLPAEVLYDAIHQVTGSPIRLPGVGPDARAIALVDPSVEAADGFLTLFGRPPRESACECERSSGISLGQTLNLINGPTVAEAINDPNNVIARLVAAQKDGRKVVEELFLSLLCRLPTEAETAASLKVFGAYDEDFTKLSTAVADYVKTLDARQPDWEKQYQGTILWREVEPVQLAAASGTTLNKQPGGIIVAGGKNPEKDTYTVTIDTDLSGITGVRLEVFSDPSLPAKGPGRAANGNFVLTDLRLSSAAKGQPDKVQPAPLQNPQADFNQDGYGVAGAIDGNPASGWAVAGALGQNHMALFEAAQPTGGPGGTRLTLTLDQQFGGQHTIGRFRASLTTSPRPLRLKEDLPKAIAEILAVAREKRSEPQKKELAGYFRSLDPEYARLSQGLAAYTRWSHEKRVIGAQDLAWALINSPAFLFNR